MSVQGASAPQKGWSFDCVPGTRFLSILSTAHLLLAARSIKKLHRKPWKYFISKLLLQSLTKKNPKKPQQITKLRQPKHCQNVLIVISFKIKRHIYISIYLNLRAFTSIPHFFGLRSAKSKETLVLCTVVNGGEQKLFCSQRWNWSVF